MTVKRILAHACCGPCFTAVHERLAQAGNQVGVYYFNPNIMPVAEYRRRLFFLERFCRDAGAVLRVGDYAVGSFAKETTGCASEEERCAACYRLRLLSTAKAAEAGGYDAFTTSLLISPHQDHEVLRGQAEAAAALIGVPFLYQDFRSVYTRSRNLAKAYRLYRQRYCGCRASLLEFQATAKDERAAAVES